MDHATTFSGSEALAQGARRAGAALVCSGPGALSTAPAAADFEGGDVLWCSTDASAIEVAVGATLAGARCVVYAGGCAVDAAAALSGALPAAGARGGLVLVCIDDPDRRRALHARDARPYASLAGAPILEPSDSQEAYDLVAEGLALSEEFVTPVLLRLTERVSAARGRVLPRVPVSYERTRFSCGRDAPFVAARAGGVDVARACGRIAALRRRAEESPLNVLEAGSADLGIVSSGAAYVCAREAFPKAWTLKLGMSHPLPVAKVVRLYQQVSRVAVVEEMEPFLEEQVRALGLPVVGRAAIPRDRALDGDVVFHSLEPFLARRPPRRRRPALPPAPRFAAPSEASPAPTRESPVCPGCSHEVVLAALARHSPTVFVDVGCRPVPGHEQAPAEGSAAVGAAVGLMAGLNAAEGGTAAAAAVDASTFLGSGLAPLLDAAGARHDGLVVVLDDRRGDSATQVAPDAGPLAGAPVDLAGLCAAAGLRCTRVDFGDAARLEAALRDGLAAQGLDVVVVRSPCDPALRRRTTANGGHPPQD